MGILEADVWETGLSGNGSVELVSGLAKGVRSQQWQVLRLAGEVKQALRECGVRQRAKTDKCKCWPASGWPQGWHTESITCVVPAARQGSNMSENSIGNRCDIRSTIAYAVHSSVFPNLSNM